jgi:hypothetical protein
VRGLVYDDDATREKGNGVKRMKHQQYVFPQQRQATILIPSAAPRSQAADAFITTNG